MPNDLVAETTWHGRGAGRNPKVGRGDTFITCANTFRRGIVPPVLEGVLKYGWMGQVCSYVSKAW